MKPSNKKNAAFFIVGIAISLVLLNLISLKGFLRLDLTRDQKYTLSQASVETVRKLDDILTVSAYFSEGLPPPYAQNSRYVHDLLEEYLAASAGRFAFEFLDPTSSETEEDKAKKKDMKHDIFGRLVRETTSVEKDLSDLGLSPVEIRVIENDEQQTKRAYMGMVIRYQDKHEVIPVIENLSDLEKNMTGLMRKLTRVKQPKLGIVKDYQGPQINKLSQALLQNMILDQVDLNQEGEIADDIDALLVVGSGDHFGDHGAQKIQNFLAKGKSAAILLDRFNVDPRSFQKQQVGPRSKTHLILDMLKNYGLEIDENLVADASCASLNMQENRGGFSFSLPVKYPFVPELMNLSYESPITKGISGVILPFVSKINITTKPNINTEILARSSKVSWLEKEPIDLNPRRDWGQSDIKPDGPHVLIVQARGNFGDAELKAEDKPIDSRLVVMGTSAFMWDDFLSGPNQLLALNIVDWMLADSALLEMRSRSFADAPLDANISDTTKQMVKISNILGVPLLLVLYGLIRWRRRESRRARA